MKYSFLLLSMMLFPTVGMAQYVEDKAERLGLGDHIYYKVELQGEASDGTTPLWLNANRHGLSSLEKTNGYLRGQVVRPLSNDSLHRWGVGYGLDVAAATGYTSNVVVQQAFVEGRWLHGVLSIGAKEYPMELKNNRLSSGSQTLGINARPVPQVRLALADYWTLPVLNRWVHVKGHVAYGKMTDDRWQHDFTRRQSKYADDVLYHSKAGYVKIGSEERFCPWSLEVGVEMATLFGGTSYVADGHGSLSAVKNESGVKGFLRAFVPGGGDAPETGTAYQNAEGDILGSWVARLKYDADSWSVACYADKFFEDHSSMFFLDYDGYGTGEEWNVKKRTHYFRYDLKDWMLGLELHLKYNRWMRHVVAEYMYTKYQSGPVYHDHSAGRPEHIGGLDNYYNHYIFTGWQHWGQAMGNPLYRSPIYNKEGEISFKNNRFVAWHVGIDGEPADRLSYRVMATCLTGYGTYDKPFDDVHHQVNVMVEAAYTFPHEWRVTGAYGMDFGHILGSNRGFQLTISKSGIFDL